MCACTVLINSLAFGDKNWGHPVLMGPPDLAVERRFARPGGSAIPSPFMVDLDPVSPRTV
jgi:hypothetical protein